MKKYLSLLLLISAVAFAQPKIRFEQTSYDFGEIEKGFHFTKEIKFTNAGNKPLIIEQVQTPDASSVADWPHEPIPRGKSGIIQYRRDISFPGKFIKSITVKTNDPLQEVVIIYVKGFVCN